MENNQFTGRIFRLKDTDTYYVINSVTEDNTNLNVSSYTDGSSLQIKVPIESIREQLSSNSLTEVTLGNNPTKDLIVIQNNETGYTFIAKANEDGTLDPLPAYQDKMGTKITIENPTEFNHSYSIANPEYIQTNGEKYTTFNLDPFSLHSLEESIKHHNQNIGQRNEDKQNFFSRFFDNVLSKNGANIRTEKEKALKKEQGSQISGPTKDDHIFQKKVDTKTLNEKLIKDQDFNKIKTSLNQWFPDVQKNLETNIANQKLPKYEDGDPASKFLNSHIVVLQDKNTAHIIVGELVKYGIDQEFQKIQLKDGSTIDHDQLKADRYSTITNSTTNQTTGHLVFEYTPITGIQERQILSISEQYNSHTNNNTESLSSSEGFSNQEVDKALELVKKAEVEHILELNNIKSTGKEITDAQRIQILKSGLTDEQKIVALTYLNDKDPAKTIKEGYEQIQNRTSKVLEHKLEKVESKKKGKGIAQKAAGTIEKVSRFTVD